MTNTEQAAQPISRVSQFARSPGVKFMIIGLLSLLLLIPSLLVWGLVEERKSASRTIEREIANSWGNRQTINGPYIAVPFIDIQKVRENNEIVEREVRNYAFFTAKTVDADATLDVEERKKSIYSVPVYRTSVTLKGQFEAPDLSSLRRDAHRVEADQAILVLGISDVRAIKNNIALKRPGQADQAFKPGLDLHSARLNGGSRANANGIHLPLSATDINKDFDFEIKADFTGTRLLQMAPSGKTTSLVLKSNWPHPGFTGSFLPETRTISEEGFEAAWRIPQLARGLGETVRGGQLPLNERAFGVSLVKPLDFYQTTARALKYGIGLISLIFLAVFILELKFATAVHWIQYLLVGLALVIFYILLLALAEQIGFDAAYGVAALSTTALIAFYIGSITRKMKTGLVMFTVTSVVYGVFYLTLRENEYALLIGSIIAFSTIAATMFATRNVDWHAPASNTPTPKA